MIGVVDSGVGGLSVLPALRETIPQAHFVVAADSGNAPYGERDDAWLQGRCIELADFLRSRGANMMVLACNTATAAAAPDLRRRYAEWPIVGIEPGLKPARALSGKGRIGVMATESTLGSARFKRLLREHGSGVQVITQACTGLAMAIEEGDEPRIESLVRDHTRPFLEAGVDVVVLGCTHYPFVAPIIQRSLGADVHILDTAQAVAKRAAALIGSEAAPAPTSVPPEFWTSGEPRALEDFAARWLGWTIKVQRLQAS